MRKAFANGPSCQTHEDGRQHQGRVILAFASVRRLGEMVDKILATVAVYVYLASESPEVEVRFVQQRGPPKEIVGLLLRRQRCP